MTLAGFLGISRSENDVTGKAIVLAIENRNERPTSSPLLQALLARPPLRLPGATIFLISGSHSAGLTPELETCLDADDRAHAARIASSDLKQRFIRGRAALRSILTACETAAVPEHAWHFERSTNGKPYVQAPKSSLASLNLSYAGPLLAIAVSETLEVGVDLELARPFPESEIPWHLFSADEQLLLRARPDKDFWQLFFRLWTLKEAIAKRTGQGFTTKFSDINTIELDIVDDSTELPLPIETEARLIHTQLSLQETTLPLHLALSTAPKAEEA